MKWLKLYPKSWRERYEEEFSYTHSKSNVRGVRMVLDLLKHFALVWLDEFTFKNGKKVGFVGTILYSVLIYAIVLCLTLLIPASEGYNEIYWKLLVGQVYAIPAFILVFFLLSLRNKILKLK